MATYKYMYPLKRCLLVKLSQTLTTTTTTTTTTKIGTLVLLMEGLLLQAVPATQNRDTG